MYADTEKKDFGSSKTKMALMLAMYSLLESRNFRKITVSNICEKAELSRVSFYAHYLDKYDLLKSWLHLKLDNVALEDTYEQKEKAVNQFVRENETAIKNLVYNADHETMAVLFDFMLSSLSLTIDNDNCDKKSPKYIVLSSFYSGGMVSYLMWLINNKFPEDVAPINVHLYEIIKKFREWQLE